MTEQELEMFHYDEVSKGNIKMQNTNSLNDLFIYFQMSLKEFADKARKNEDVHFSVWNNVVNKVERDVLHAISNAMIELSNFESLVREIKENMQRGEDD
jgi:hypothetical protein